MRVRRLFSSRTIFGGLSRSNIARALQCLLIGALLLQSVAPALAFAEEAAPARLAPAAGPAQIPSIAAPVSPPAIEDDPVVVYTPADLAEGAAVTINVAPAEIPAGDTVTVSGKGAAGSARVRLAAVHAGQTVGIRDVDLDVNGNYATGIPVDATYPVGPLQICALAIGLEDAEVACATLVITAPPAGSVSGQLPLAGIPPAEIAELDADFRLMDAAGAVLYSTPLLADGSFRLENVAPGPYLYAVAGLAPVSTYLGSMQVEPVRNRQIELLIESVCNVASILRPTSALSANPSRAGFTRTSLYNGLTWEYKDEVRPFGIYVTGVKNIVTFTAAPQTKDVAEKVIFEFYDANDRLVEKFERSAPFAVDFNVGRLRPSRNGLHPYVTITPVVGGKQTCASYYDIEVMDDPMANPYLQQMNSRTTWQPATRSYEFEGVLPEGFGALPYRYTVATVEFLGELTNEFNSGILVKGSFNLEGKARIFLAEAFAKALLLSLPILGGETMRENVTPPGLGAVEFDIRNPAHMAIPFGPLELFQRDVLSVPIKMLVFSYFGIVNAYVAGGVTFGVGLYLEGDVRPLAPEIDSTLTGNASFSADLGLSVDLLLGLVEGGGGLGGQVCAGLPLRLLFGAAEWSVGFDNPVVGGRLYAVLWGSALWGFVKERTTKTLVSFARGCPGAVNLASGLEAETDSTPAAPDVFRSPVVVASSSGDMLAAYVENTAPVGATPQIQIMARFQNAETGIWSEPQAISDPAHSSQSPTVALVGSGEVPMVAWSENTLTAAEAAALGNEDPAAHLRHQEIVYSLWTGSWSAPIHLTDNQLPDGLPEAAGAAEASILAWITDLDGDANTRNDQQIAVSFFDNGSQRFGEPALLSYAASSLNNDLAVAVSPFGLAYIAWVYDLDADLTTAGDRRLEVVEGIPGEWSSLNPQPLPPRVDSPSLAYTPDGLQLAFLVREPAPDGEVGLLGTNGVLWSARLDNDNRWTAQPLQDTAGKQIHAEQPQLAGDGAEALLVFRRFDEVIKRGAIGQLSLSRIYEANQPSPPLYLTDAPQQQWLPAVAINPANSQAIVLHSVLPVSAATAAAVTEPLAASEAVAASRAGVLASGASPVLMLVLENEADPALDPLQVSAQAPAPGATVVVSATVRNVGRRESGDVLVYLYRGTSPAGELLATEIVPGLLDFNAAATLAFYVPAPTTLDTDGTFSFFAELRTNGENITYANDTASITLGGLSAPSRVELAGSNPEFDGALDLFWSGNAGEYVTGYRILRADTATGPWALVGESAVPAFADTVATYGQTYCYAAQAYNDQEAFSPRGQASCAPFLDIAEYSMFLPEIQRR